MRLAEYQLHRPKDLPAANKSGRKANGIGKDTTNLGSTNPLGESAHTASSRPQTHDRDGRDLGAVSIGREERRVLASPQWRAVARSSRYVASKWK